jgi:hypothetical protein
MTAEIRRRRRFVASVAEIARMSTDPRAAALLAIAMARFKRYFDRANRELRAKHGPAEPGTP